MRASRSNARRAAHATKVAARSAQASGVIKCYVELFELPNGMPDLRLREKATRRTVRVLTRQPMMQQVAPLSNLLQDCHAHGGGLVEPRGRKEFVAISAPIVTQNAEEIAVSFDGNFSVKVNILTAEPVPTYCADEQLSSANNRAIWRSCRWGVARLIESPFVP
jgi:hypothetical protein